MSRSDILIAGGAMVATAGVGVLGTDVDSRWYRGLLVEESLRSARGEVEAEQSNVDD